MEHDLRNFNIKKSENIKIKEFFQIENSYSRLKEIYINILSLSQHVDGVDYYGILKYFDRIRFQKVTPKDIKQLFYDVLDKSSEKLKSGWHKNKNLMCRKEFIELWFQLAKIEYDTEKEPDYLLLFLKRL